jgi:prevent-host-death family protein
MRTVSVTEFKSHCLEFVSQVARTGEPMMLTKHGKPTVMIGAARPETERKWVLGQFKDKCKIVGDIIAPFDEPCGVD